MWSQSTNDTDRQTERRTTCDRKTTLCPMVHRAVQIRDGYALIIFRDGRWRHSCSARCITSLFPQPPVGRNIMDRAEKHPACNYCEPFVFVEDPFAVYRPTWFASTSIVLWTYCLVQNWPSTHNAILVPRFPLPRFQSPRVWNLEPYGPGLVSSSTQTSYYPIIVIIIIIKSYTRYQSWVIN